jgi:hypothetical protein
MTNSNYKSLGSILWKLLQNPLCQELTYEEAAEYALECIKLLGAPVLYLNKIEQLNLTTYKAELPCDLLYIEGVRYFESDNTNPIAMRESSNLYHLSGNEFNNSDDNSYYSNSEFTYKIQNGIIFTSTESGCVEISYRGIATDEEGYPLVPDNQKVELALEYYILSRYLEPLWMVGKVSDKAFEYIQQKRYFYVPSAFTSAIMPSIDKMSTLMNGLNRLLINTSAHDNFFKKFGEKERIRKQF